jgi:hypothetical protein
MPEKSLQNLKPKKTLQTRKRRTTPTRKPVKKSVAKNVSPKASDSSVSPKKRFEGGVTQDMLTEPGDLPEMYGDPKVVLMPVDSYLANVYWEIDVGEVEGICRRLKVKFNRLQPVLRFHDLTGTGFDMDIDLRAGNWYVHRLCPGNVYLADLGIKTEGGIFFPLLRSNTVEMPRSRPQPEKPGEPIQIDECVFVSRHEARRKVICPLDFGRQMSSSEEAAPLRTLIGSGPEDQDLTAVNEKVFSPGISSSSVPSE